MIALYLISIVLANLLILTFGPIAAPVVNFCFIGFDFTCRDGLHERWHNRHLWRNMAILIFSGSALSALINYNALTIAAASFLAFLVAGIVDSLVYRVLFNHDKLIKMNTSNLFSSIVDSVIFASIAFGFPILWDVILYMILAKLAGGFIWSLIFKKDLTHSVYP